MGMECKAPTRALSNILAVRKSSSVVRKVFLAFTLYCILIFWIIPFLTPSLLAKGKIRSILACSVGKVKSTVPVFVFWLCVAVKLTFTEGYSGKVLE